MRKFTEMALAGVVSLLIAGCSQPARDQYGDAGQDASNAVKQTGQAAVTDAANSKTAADNTLETTRVTGALKSAAGLETKNINVDSDEKAGTVTLNGSVPDVKQKGQAETVATGIAGSAFKIVDNLKIAGA